MRFRHPDGTAVHLGYCSNVHQAEDVDGVLAQLTDYAEPVRERLGVDRLGIGLWLARDVVSELVAVPGVLQHLKDELAARDWRPSPSTPSRTPGSTARWSRRTSTSPTGRTRPA